MTIMSTLVMFVFCHLFSPFLLGGSNKYWLLLWLADDHEVRPTRNGDTKHLPWDRFLLFPFGQPNTADDGNEQWHQKGDFDSKDFEHADRHKRAESTIYGLGYRVGKGHKNHTDETANHHRRTKDQEPVCN